MKRWWQLRSLAPAMMVVAALVNFGLCFKSLDWLAFRTWEAATAVEHPSGIGPFEPGSMILKEHAYGDLAGLGNMKDMREYRLEVFRVDQFGFRNSHTAPPWNPIGFVVGDSFTVGAGVSDSETLPVQLTRDAGAYYYNGGGVSTSFKSAEAVSSILRLSSGTLVYQLLERSARSAPPPLSQITQEYKSEPTKPRSIKETIRAMLLTRAVDLFLSDHSPGIILSRKLVKSAEDELWLPNPYSKDVVRRRLQNGEEILFYPDDLKPTGDLDELSSAWRSYLAAFSGRMAEQNITMIVLLVPDKYTVYGPLTDAQMHDFGGEKLLGRFEKELRAAGVPTLNLTPLFRTSAAQGLGRREYLYWRDDTHWNAHGIKLAADALWSELQKMRIQNGHVEPAASAALTHSRIYRNGRTTKHN